jgi:hypothetical protein
VKYEKMSKQAMWEIGTKLIADYLKSKDYTILETSPFYYTYPNVVAKKDDKLYGVIIDANEIHNQPKHSVRRTFDMMRFARKFDAVPLYASIGIASTDTKKFEKGILYDNDPKGYYVNFEGLKDINYDVINELNEEERKEYIVNLFGECYEKCNFDVLEKYLAPNCKWYSIYSGVEYNTKEDIMYYYGRKSKAMSKTIMNYSLVKFVGSWYEFKAGELELPDGIKRKNATVRMPQPDGEIGVVVEQIKNPGEDKVGMAVTIGFDDNGLINDIYLGDPYAMNFVDYYECAPKGKNN